jgi:hypothetical protein
MVSEFKPCPCNCGMKTVGGRYARGHKPKNTAAAAPGNGSRKLLGRCLLLVNADDALCNSIWARLRLEQKVTALNSLEK